MTEREQIKKLAETLQATAGALRKAIDTLKCALPEGHLTGLEEAHRKAMADAFTYSQRNMDNMKTYEARKGIGIAPEYR